MRVRTECSSNVWSAHACVFVCVCVCVCVLAHCAFVSVRAMRTLCMRSCAWCVNVCISIFCVCTDVLILAQEYRRWIHRFKGCAETYNVQHDFSTNVLRRGLCRKLLFTLRTIKFAATKILKILSLYGFVWLRGCRKAHLQPWRPTDLLPPSQELWRIIDASQRCGMCIHMYACCLGLCVCVYGSVCMEVCVLVRCVHVWLCVGECNPTSACVYGTYVCTSVQDNRADNKWIGLARGMSISCDIHTGLCSSCFSVKGHVLQEGCWDGVATVGAVTAKEQGCQNCACLLKAVCLPCVFAMW
jgi:hypothetical protein